MTPSFVQLAALLWLCSGHAHSLTADEVARLVVGQNPISALRWLEEQQGPSRPPRSAEANNDLWDTFSRIKGFAQQFLNLQEDQQGNSSVDNATLLLYEAIKREIGSVNLSASALSPRNDASLASRAGLILSSGAETPTTQHPGFVGTSAALPASQHLDSESAVLRDNLTDSQLGKVLTETTTVRSSENNAAASGTEVVEESGPARILQPESGTTKSLPYPPRSSPGVKSAPQSARPARTSAVPRRVLSQPPLPLLKHNSSASGHATASPTRGRMEATSVGLSYLASTYPQTASALNLSDPGSKAILLEVMRRAKDSRNDSQENPDPALARQTQASPMPISFPQTKPVILQQTTDQTKSPRDASGGKQTQEAEQELPASTASWIASVPGTLRSEATLHAYHILVRVKGLSTQLPLNSRRHGTADGPHPLSPPPTSGLQVADERQTFWSTEAAAESSQETPGTEDPPVMGNSTDLDDLAADDEAFWELDGAGNWSRSALLGNDSADHRHTAFNLTGRELQAKGAPTSSEEVGSNNTQIHKALLALGIILLLVAVAGVVVLIDVRRKRFRRFQLNRGSDERNHYGEPVVQFSLLPKESVSIQTATTIDGMP